MGKARAGAEYDPMQVEIDGDVSFVVVVGGVCSSLGKGVTASGIGAILRAQGVPCTAIKIDPYLNPDAGLMSPFEHGEVFVLADGGEADLDLGNYERTMQLTLSADHNITTGKVYTRVIRMERDGRFLGRTVQVVPHVTGEILKWLASTAAVPSDGTGRKPAVCVVELGGTVGDIESAPYLEALRQLKALVTRKQRQGARVGMALCLVTFVPLLSGQKTKPTQHTVRALMAAGLQPDVILCRCEEEVLPATKAKIATLCSVSAEAVFGLTSQPNLFHVPLALHAQGITAMLSEVIGHRLEDRGRESIARLRGEAPALAAAIMTLDDWRRQAAVLDEVSADAAPALKIVMVGKYLGTENVDTVDAYLSVRKALLHAGLWQSSPRRVALNFLASDNAADATATLRTAFEQGDVHGVIIPGGFGERGLDGKVAAARFAREAGVPYLGLCLGLQVAVIERARACGWDGATSEEFVRPEGALAGAAAATGRQVVIAMPEVEARATGASLRRGERVTPVVRKDSMLAAMYGGADAILERHRHRFEVDPTFVPELLAAAPDVIFAGIGDEGRRHSTLELARDRHPFFFGSQYHPEFKTQITSPSPPFAAFLAAAEGVRATFAAAGPGAATPTVAQLCEGRPRATVEEALGRLRAGGVPVRYVPRVVGTAPFTPTHSV